MTEITKYEDIRDSLKTGDLVLFSGKSFISKAISLFTRSPHSHIGIVRWDTQLNMYTIWESTTLSNLPDIYTGKKTNGVQNVLLSKRIATYDGEISIRRLNKPLQSNMYPKLCKAYRELNNRPYEKSYANLLFAMFEKVKGKEDLSTMFCSELVAEVYQAVGLLTEERPSDKYTPADFSEEFQDFDLELGYELGKEIRIK